MNGELIVAVFIGVPSISWMIVRCQASKVTQRITEHALDGCPATQRAEVLRASAELAGELIADRVMTVPFMQVPRRSPSGPSAAHSLVEKVFNALREDIRKS